MTQHQISQTNIYVFSHHAEVYSAQSKFYVHEAYSRLLSGNYDGNALFPLSKKTTIDERADFTAYDFTREVENTINRFALHTSEIAENLQAINRIIFADIKNPAAPPELLIILGSRNCQYKAEKALSISKDNPEMRYLVSGGNSIISGTFTEAKFMASFLRRNGIPENRIIIEDKAKYSCQNLEYSRKIIQTLKADGKPLRSIGIVTSGFHLSRVKLLAEHFHLFDGMNVSYFPAYGPHTSPDNWYKTETGRESILNELRKTMQMLIIYQERRLYDDYGICNQCIRH